MNSPLLWSAVLLPLLAADPDATLQEVSLLQFVTLPATTFWMGSDDPQAPENQRPRHQVQLTQPVHLSTSEITVSLFSQFVAETDYRTDAEKDGRGGMVWDPSAGKAFQVSGVNWRQPGVEVSPDDPVVQVSWRDASLFCQWLSGKLGVEIRLPTEAEWEYACSLAAEDASGSLKDLVSMHEGPAEWCWDLYKTGYPEEQLLVDPMGPEQGSYRVYRGSSVAGLADCKTRFQKPAHFRASYLGFRVVRTEREFVPRMIEPWRAVPGPIHIRRRNERTLANPLDYYSPHLDVQRVFELQQDYKYRRHPFHRFWVPLPPTRRPLGNLPLETRGRYNLAPTPSSR